MRKEIEKRANRRGYRLEEEVNQKLLLTAQKNVQREEGLEMREQMEATRSDLLVTCRIMRCWLQSRHSMDGIEC